MPRTTTIERLRGYHQKLHPDKYPSWAGYHHDHPLPTLPNDEALLEYLEQVGKSTPHLLSEATELVEEVIQHRSQVNHK